MMGWWPLVGPCRRWSKVPRTTYMFVHSMHDHELSGLCPAIVFLAAIICSIFHAMSFLLVKNKPLPYQFALCARTFSQKHLTNSAAVTSVQTAQRLRNAATHGHRHADTCSGYPAAQKGAAPLSVFFPNWFAAKPWMKRLNIPLKSLNLDLFLRPRLGPSVGFNHVRRPVPAFGRFRVQGLRSLRVRRGELPKASHEGGGAGGQTRPHQGGGGWEETVWDGQGAHLPCWIYNMAVFGGWLMVNLFAWMGSMSKACGVFHMKWKIFRWRSQTA